MSGIIVPPSPIVKLAANVAITSGTNFIVSLPSGFNKFEMLLNLYCTLACNVAFLGSVDGTTYTQFGGATTYIAQPTGASAIEGFVTIANLPNTNGFFSGQYNSMENGVGNWGGPFNATFATVSTALKNFKITLSAGAFTGAGKYTLYGLK